MRAGKLAGAVEKRSVLKLTGAKGTEPAQVVCSYLPEGECLVMAADQTGLFGTAQTKELRIGALFDRVGGKLAAQGAEEEAFIVSLSAVPGMDEAELKQITGMIAKAAGCRGITDYTIHAQTRYEPEESGAAVQLVLTGSGVGKAAVQPALEDGGAGKVAAQPVTGGDAVKTPENPVHLPGTGGMQIVMAGYAALEATAVLISEKRELLAGRLSEGYLSEGLAKARQTDVREAARIAVQAGALVKTAGEGGIFTALWELGEHLDCGMDIALRDILLLQETIEVCEVLDVNPYLLASGGCILAVTEDAERLLERYRAAGIAAAVIGSLKDGHDRVLRNGEEERFLEPFRSEELYRVL